MHNGVTFGDKHSYTDFGLILEERPTVSPPEPKTVYVEVPGADGILDLSEVVTGEVMYKERTITCKFGITDAREKWNIIYSNVLNALNGKRMKIILDEEPEYYYQGRVTVSDWDTDIAFPVITIKAIVDPYKMDLFSSAENWAWDTFNFETGVIHDPTVTVSGTTKITVVNGRKTVIPTLTTSVGGITVTVGGTKYLLRKGVNKIAGIKLKEGETVLSFSGTGTVTIDYRGGSL